MTNKNELKNYWEDDKRKKIIKKLENENIKSYGRQLIIKKFGKVRLQMLKRMEKFLIQKY